MDSVPDSSVHEDVAAADDESHDLESNPAAIDARLQEFLDRFEESEKAIRESLRPGGSLYKMAVVQKAFGVAAKGNPLRIFNELINLIQNDLELGTDPEHQEQLVSELKDDRQTIKYMVESGRFEAMHEEILRLDDGFDPRMFPKGYKPFGKRYLELLAKLVARNGAIEELIDLAAQADDESAQNQSD